jgi:hypothetical protein
VHWHPESATSKRTRCFSDVVLIEQDPFEGSSGQRQRQRQFADANTEMAVRRVNHRNLTSKSPPLPRIAMALNLYFLTIFESIDSLLGSMSYSFVSIFGEYFVGKCLLVRTSLRTYFVRAIAAQAGETILKIPSIQPGLEPEQRDFRERW